MGWSSKQGAPHHFPYDKANLVQVGKGATRDPICPKVPSPQLHGCFG